MQARALTAAAAARARARGGRGGEGKGEGSPGLFQWYQFSCAGSPPCARVFASSVGLRSQPSDSTQSLFTLRSWWDSAMVARCAYGQNHAE